VRLELLYHRRKLLSSFAQFPVKRLNYFNVPYVESLRSACFVIRECQNTVDYVAS